MLEITVLNKDNNVVDATIETEDYVLLYLEGGKIKAKGDISLKSLAPTLTKFVLDKLSK